MRWRSQNKPTANRYARDTSGTEHLASLRALALRGSCEMAAASGISDSEAAFAAGRITGLHRARKAKLMLEPKASLAAFAEASPFRP